MTEAMPRAADPRVDEILAIIARETGVEQAALRSDATIQDLGIASLDMAQTLFALESHFDVEIPVVADRAGAEFATVAELVTHVLATLDRPRPTTGNTAPGVIA
ncbi:acyl carrier protein [Rhodovastum atsumiense]|nr:phosphopantetheine-binding protein [Rhodovastum atsumiense]